LAIVGATTNLVLTDNLTVGLASAHITVVSLGNSLIILKSLAIVCAATDFVLADNLATVLTRAHVAVIAL